MNLFSNILDAFSHQTPWPRVVSRFLILSVLCSGFFITSVDASCDIKEIPEGAKQGVTDIARENFKCIKSKLDGIAKLEEKYIELLDGLENAVIAFNSPNCPVGWSVFKDSASRFIVGVGKSDGFERKALGQIGGIESYSLTKEQMPKHQHNTPQAMDNTGVNFGLGPKRKSVHGSAWADSTTEMTSWEGEGETVNNMPPFIALKYCIKE